MAEMKHFKVVASLPSPLEPDSVYYVRVGQGYDQYVTNGVGVVVAYEANSKLALESKVDKEEGKQLSDENFTLDEKDKLASLENFDDSAIQVELDTKVDKIAGKGLSTEDFTSAEKGKLAGLENFDDSVIQAELANKVDKVAGKQLSDQNYTLVEKNKLTGVAVGATANATNAQLRDRATHTGVQPIASVEGLQDALGEKVDNTDPRLTDAREWTATVVSQAEAEAGTSTTARKWTAQRVRQAILGWWNTSTFKTKLDGIEAGATKNATDAQLRSRATHTGVQPISSVTNLQSSLDSKVDKQSGYGLSQENYTPAEKSKLSSLEGSKFKGEYVSLAALEAAQPSPEVGSYAYVDAGVGEVVSKYIWDSSDAEWAKQQGETASLTPSEVKSLYEENPDTNAFSDSEKTKLSGIQAGATANATNAQLRDRATHTGVQPISSVTGLQTGLDSKADTSYVNTQLGGKVDKTISVVAGTGLSGGGTLSASRTLNVQYGTTAGTAAQGNDSRLSDSREWTAAVVTQAEAEAGTATTARKWTSQRIRQAILGWWNGSPDKTKLDGIESGAQVNSVTSVAGKTGAVTLTHTDVNAAPTSHTHPLSQITDAGNLASLSTNASTANFLRGDGTWVTPPNTNTTYTEITTAEIDAGTASTSRTITGRRMKYALDKKADVSHTHTLSQITDAGSVAGISTNGSAANFLRGDGTWVTPPNTNTTYSAGTGIALTGTTFSLADERFTSALSSKLGGIATGATANSTDAQLRARSTHTGTQAMSTVVGLETALGGKVDTTDSRLSDSREWTATVVSQAEAQAGTATTERKWTAQRVAQAISALGLSIGTTATTAKAGNWMPTWANVTGKPTTFTPSAHTHSLSQITDAGSVASLNTNASTANFLRGDGTWVTPPNTNTTYSEITTAEIDTGTASTSRTISGRRMKYALDKKADAVHGHSISDVTGLQVAIDSKANTSTQVIAGTGLSGGGTLAANRTLSVNYGTAAGTAAQGNDSRLSNSREWTASVVSQAEAEAGTATTARKWTSQRVAQAISALGLKIGTTASTAKAGNWTPTWTEVSGKPTTFTPATHTHSAGEITSGVLAYARIPTIRHGDTDFANQALNIGSSVQHATVRTGGTVDDGTNSLQVDGGTRTDTLAAGGVQAAEESIDTDGNIQVRGEGQLKMGDFSIQYNAATKSLDFNFMET